ncbi:MAG: RecX family transcriptional regulator [Mediterranea sp.]|jgi:regulatory protein|nr:RecX family transcriptional regulator [Mediterranea sp.]
MKELTESEAFNRAAAYCSVAEHCSHEVSEKLRRWEVDAPVAQRILHRLIEEKYVDDLRYSRAFVRDKYRFAKWGKVKIAAALHIKHIPGEVVQQALESIDEEEYLDTLRDLLAAKQKSIRAANDYERKGKLIRFALGRGYEMHDIRKVGV